MSARGTKSNAGARRLEGKARKNKQGGRERRAWTGWPVSWFFVLGQWSRADGGRTAGRPSGGLCHVAAAKTRQKEEEGATGGARQKEWLFASDAATAQQRVSAEGTKEGWRWVNSGEILLVSVKDGPWSALVSWRRRGFSRASPVPSGGGGKWVWGARGWWEGGWERVRAVVGCRRVGLGHHVAEHVVFTLRRVSLCLSVLVSPPPPPPRTTFLPPIFQY